MSFSVLRCATATLLFCFGVSPAQVGWLQYAIPPDPPRYHDMPHAVVVLGNGAGQEAPEEQAAAEELDRGLGHMVAGTDLLLHRFDPRLDAIVLGTTEAVHRARLGRLPGWTERPLPEEGFRIVHLRRGIRHWYILQGGSPRAELWAAFRFAALVAEDQQLPTELVEFPQIATRGIDLGAEPAALLADEPRLTSLARLLASTGCNTLVAAAANAADAAAAGRTLQHFGIRLWLHAGATAPFAAGGYVVSAAGAADAGVLRSAIDRANALAQAARRPGSVVLSHALGDPFPSAAASPVTPEERAAMLRERLQPGILLGGPAVPATIPLAGLGSPSFGLLQARAQAGQIDVLPSLQDRLVFPYVVWQSILATPQRGPYGSSTLLEALRVEADGAHGALIGSLPAARLDAVFQQPMLQANLYAFGRLAWDPGLKPEAVAEEWARQTWGDDARIYGVAQRILLGSVAAAVNNSSPFGLGSLLDATGGPSPSQAALQKPPLVDAHGLGTDRTARGTGEVQRYPDAFAARLADLSQCPDEWLLAVHRVPFDHRLRSGKTVVQAFYDAHFAGAAESANALDAWEETRELADAERYRAVHAFLEESAMRAEIARETLTEWMQRTSGVQDALGFVGSHPGRVEAEAMQRSGFAPRRSETREDASGGAYLSCPGGECTAATVFPGAENVYRVETGFFDPVGAPAAFELWVNGTPRARWQSAATQTEARNATTARRFVTNGVRLQPGDRVEISAKPAEGSSAALDFVEITRDPRWN